MKKHGKIMENPRNLREKPSKTGHFKLRTCSKLALRQAATPAGAPLAFKTSCPRSDCNGAKRKRSEESRPAATARKPKQSLATPLMNGNQPVFTTRIQLKHIKTLEAKVPIQKG